MRYGHGFGERRPPTVEYFNPPAEIRENTKARRAWCAAKQAELTAAGRVAKTVGIGSYQCVSAKIVKLTTTTTQMQGLCQGCGGQWAIVGGKVSHHGYQRPGHGWQTQSCAGARYVPLSESADRTMAIAHSVALTIQSVENNIGEVERGEHATVTIEKYDREKRKHYPSAVAKSEVSADVWTRGTEILLSNLRSELRGWQAHLADLTQRLTDFNAGKFVGTTKLVTITK